MTIKLFILLLSGALFQSGDKDFDYYLSGFSRNSDIHPDSALYYARNMLEAAQREDDSYLVVRAEYALGYTYRYLNDYVSAINHYRNSWQIARSHGYEEREMMATNGLGMSMYRAGNYPEALRYLYLSLLIREKRDNPEELSRIYNNIGLVYLKLWNWQKAHEYFTKALESRDSLDERAAATLVNLGVCLPNMGRVEEAHLRLAQFREVCEEGCGPQLWCDYYNALGGLYLNQDELQSALIYFEKALQLSKENGLTGHQEMAFDNLSILKKDMGDFNQASLYSDSALHLALQLNMPQRIQSGFRQKAELETNMGHKDEALSMWAKYDSMRELVTGAEIMNELYSHELEWMKTAYNLELMAQQAQIDKSRRTNIIFVVMSIAVGLLALLWWHNYRRKKLALDRLQAAQQQLVRQEKLAALGSLMAGIAHELNNPLAAAMISVKSGQHYLKQVTGRVKDISELSANGNHQDGMMTGLQRRRAREALLEQLPDWPDRDVMAENLLDTGMAKPELIEKFSNYEDLRELLDALLLEKDLERINRSLESMHSVVRSLQDSSRGGTDNYLITDVELQKSLGGALILLHNQLKYHIEIKQDYPDNAVMVKANPQRLSQVWINLLINGIQAVPDEHGIIAISIDNRFADHVRVEISDNGRGIDTDHQARVFDKFFTTRIGENGNGLGLHIVREIIDELEGRISFVSSKAGTRMSVFLPRS